jgi:hypothetical protein
MRSATWLSVVVLGAAVPLMLSCIQWTDRPSRVTGTDTSYTLPYTATKDSEWRSSPTGPNPVTGPVMKGTKVCLNAHVPAGDTNWVDAMFMDRTVKWISYQDFETNPEGHNCPPSPD